MRVHPTPAINKIHKNLRRLPHIFAKVLELPFQSNTDVLVEDSSGCFRFVVKTDDVAGDVSAKTVDIYPGITKIVVIRGDDYPGLPVIHELEFDIWRFRLPAATLPEMATADYSEGKLIVTVPKDPSRDGGPDVDDDEEDGWGEEENAGFVTGPTLVLVQ